MVSKESNQNESAFVSDNQDGLLAFLYLKEEAAGDNDLQLDQNTLKIGTLKIEPHGTRLGERFIKIAFDKAREKNLNFLYVTVFSKHEGLLKLFEKYGFIKTGTKKTKDSHGEARDELILQKDLSKKIGDICKDYPNFSTQNNKFLLSINPKYHTALFPDSQLKTEKEHTQKDIAHTNSIHKIYLSAAHGLNQLEKGDLIVIYRTVDGGSAEYSSVATSLCVAQEKALDIYQTFSSEDEFIKKTSSYSVFSKEELRTFWQKKRYPNLLKFTYNLSFKKKIIRKALADDCSLDRGTRWTFLKLTNEQFKLIFEKGMNRD